MSFKTFKTYGKHKYRVIKTDLWISPERKPLFSSSDSSLNSTDHDIHVCRARININSLDTDTSNCSNSLRYDTSTTNTSVEHDSLTDFPNASKQKSLAPSFAFKQKNSPVFLEHSTPLSRRSHGTTATTYAQQLKEISPFIIIDSSVETQSNTSKAPFPSDYSPFGSRSLFSDSDTASDGNSMSTLSISEDEVINESKSNNELNLNHVGSTQQQSGSHISISDTEFTNVQKSSQEVQSISDEMKDLRLLDVKVYLDSNEGLRLSKSSNVEMHLDVSNMQEKSHSDKKTKTLSSQNSTPELSQSIDYKQNKEFEMATMTENTAYLTPNLATNQLIAEKLKNENCLSFVEALTPLRFQRRRTLSAKEKILVHCEQKKPLKFSDALKPSVLAKCVKVGEGTYGEVYKTNNGLEDVALKVIPIEGNFLVNNESQKSFEEMISEIVISRELSNLGDVDDVQNALNVCPNFIKVKRVMLIQDGYPQILLEEWDKWKNGHKCENERPDQFPPNQYFIMFEFIDGGEDLERFEFCRMEEALSVLQQVLLSLCVSEHALMFEHRDLHWGNVLIKRSKCQTLHYKLNGEDIQLESAGVFVSIIDFTLSRLTKDGLTVFCDLSKDPDIFTGKGDYQFQIYRLMRKANQDDWEAHVPYSNVLWIRYLIDKILNAKQYQVKNTALQRNLRTFVRQVLSYDSALNALQNGLFGVHFSGIQN